MALAPDDMGGTERGNAMRLVTAHRSGDTSAFTEIVRTHYPTLLACARRRLANPQDAEDAVQEAFLRAYRRLGTFGNEGDWRLGAWLNTILSNVCTDILVRRRPSAPFEEWAGGRPDDRPDAAELVSDHVVLQAVARAIATLPESQRSAFVLRMVDDRPYDEVAAALGITEDNARARVARARSALQRTLSRSEALTGMLAAAPLLVAGSLRSALRRIFSSNASDSAHATAATTLATNATTEMATVTSGPVGSSMQLIGQIASTPVAQAALAASASGGARGGSVVLGVVALAAAGGLSVPAVAAVAAPTPGTAIQAAPHLVSATSPVTTGAPAAPSTAQAAPAATAASTMPSDVASAPPAPSWVALAASAAVNGRAAVTSDASSASSTPTSSAGTTTATGTATTSGSSASGSPPASTSSASTSPATGATSPDSAAGTGGYSLPIGTCTGVAGFPGVTAPTSTPPLSSDTLVAVMSTGTQSFASANGGPAFQATGSMSPMSGSAAPVNVKVGTCLAAGGSILAVDMTGTTGAEVQLVGSLVSDPSTAATGSGARGAIDFLFRGQVTQIAGKVLTGGRLPWDLTSSFVAEVQEEPGDTASIQVVFLQTIGATTSASASSGSSSGASGEGRAHRSTGTGTSSSTPPATVTRVDGTPPQGSGSTAGAASATGSTGSTGSASSTGPTKTPA